MEYNAHEVLQSRWRLELTRAEELEKIQRAYQNNLMPYIQQVAVGRLHELNVFGHDYPTKDGSTARDYIHVMDLVDGHVAANKIFIDSKIGCTAYNLRTGQGTFVLEMVATFEKASRKLCARRAGDATAVYTSTQELRKNSDGILRVANTSSLELASSLIQLAYGDI